MCGHTYPSKEHGEAEFCAAMETLVIQLLESMAETIGGFQNNMDKQNF